MSSKSISISLSFYFMSSKYFYFLINKGLSISLSFTNMNSIHCLGSKTNADWLFVAIYQLGLTHWDISLQHLFHLLRRHWRNPKQMSSLAAVFSFCLKIFFCLSSFSNSNRERNIWTRKPWKRHAVYLMHASMCSCSFTATSGIYSISSNSK